MTHDQTGRREVATIPAADQEDGCDAVIYVARHPAMFWRVVGGGVDLTTGSGSDDTAGLALRIASAIALDMLGPSKEPSLA